MSRVLEDTLVRREIAYQVIGGTKFYERAEIKDAIAYLSLLANPFDVVSFTRVANSPRRGLGQTSLSRIVAHSASVGVSVWEAASAPDRIPGLGTAAIKSLRRFMDTMDELRLRLEQETPVADLLEAMLSQTGYIDALEAERTIEAQGRIENLEQLVQVGREFDTGAPEGEDTLEVFLQQIALVADADSRTEDEGLVTLMTLHNAKGLEYPIVFIAGCEDGVFPHSRALDEGALEEERRLFYVGVTRAMREAVPDPRAPPRGVRRADATGCRAASSTRFPRSCSTACRRRRCTLGPAPVRRGRGNGGSSLGGGAPAGGWGGRPGVQGESLLGASAAGRRPPGRRFAWARTSSTRPSAKGVVTGVEPGGVIVVRFADDGSERKLMAEYAPVARR